MNNTISYYTHSDYGSGEMLEYIEGEVDSWLGMSKDAKKNLAQKMYNYFYEQEFQVSFDIEGNIKDVNWLKKSIA